MKTARLAHRSVRHACFGSGLGRGFTRKCDHCRPPFSKQFGGRRPLRGDLLNVGGPVVDSLDSAVIHVSDCVGKLEHTAIVSDDDDRSIRTPATSESNSITVCPVPASSDEVGSSHTTSRGLWTKAPPSA